MLWALDRVTFRSIVLASRRAKRQRFDAALDAMAVFATLTPDSRAAMADCFAVERFQVGPQTAVHAPRHRHDHTSWGDAVFVIKCRSAYNNLPCKAEHRCLRWCLLRPNYSADETHP